MLVPIGIHKDTGETVDIDDLDTSQRGLKCNCICPNPECQAPLIARFCTDKINHFAHHKIKASVHCEMSALHLMAQEYFLTLNTMTIPIYTVLTVEYYSDILGIKHNHEPLSVFNSPVSLTNTGKEVSVGGKSGIRCDILTEATYQGVTFPLNIEIKVTSKVNEIKLEKIRQLGITTVEIDLYSLKFMSQLSIFDIRNAIHEPFNSHLLHVSKQVYENLKATELVQRKEREISINKSKQDWLIDVANLFKNSDFKFPDYPIPHIQTSYWDWYRRQPDFIRAIEFKPNKSVKDVTIENNTIFLHMHNRDEALPVHIISDIEASHRRDFNKGNFLYINPLKSELTAIYNNIKWGKNTIIDAEIIKHYSSVDRAYKQHLEDVKTLIQTLRVKHQDALEQFKLSPVATIVDEAKQARKWLFSKYPDKDAALICEPLKMERSLEHMFGVPASIWQPIAAYQYLSGKALSSAQVIQSLEGLGISVTDAYNQLRELDVLNYKPVIFLMQIFLHEKLGRIARGSDMSKSNFQIKWLER